MNWFDLVLLGILALSVVMGFSRGLAREVLSMLSWVIAFLVSFYFAEELAFRLQYSIGNELLRWAIAYGGLFLATLIVGALVTFFCSRFISATGLSGTDRLLGVVFGSARGIVIMGLLVFITDFAVLSSQPWWQNSLMVNHLAPLANWFGQWIPTELTGQA